MNDERWLWELYKIYFRQYKFFSFTEGLEDLSQKAECPNFLLSGMEW